MGIVKISNELHDEIRKSCSVMSRSINSQAEFWIKMGMLAELNPTLSFHEIIKKRLLKEVVTISGVINEQINDQN